MRDLRLLVRLSHMLALNAVLQDHELGLQSIVAKSWSLHPEFTPQRHDPEPLAQRLQGETSVGLKLSRTNIKHNERQNQKPYCPLNGSGKVLENPADHTTIMPWSRSQRVPWSYYYVIIILYHYDIMASWYHDTMAPWCHTTSAPYYIAAVLLCCNPTMQPWFPITVLPHYPASIVVAIYHGGSSVT